ncbi:MAG: hypothetical protein LKE46_14875 [Clostridium sp.]|jgi:hypothetical protein|uniref:hypothetical protein n=1 Tax=Clostridium sp. TaxID=1506 RepID=UPI0025BB2ADA|nr:hypothetical protein [Clostridium sp.]MCH3965519.1 hypothetical protein [Clostridium sp.]MCI1716848.1 hypothetical protein [Clostridium sp.]MCI1801222.1 hypothetical protein [Clostridium sp.]MCI1815034.1 hypothetical protein [Clostridium sp.]MCI1871935.1 hypothetical protein [Clostridium sp.]
MNKDDIIKALDNIIKKDIIKADDFWLSNKSALVFYGIENDLDYVSINCRQNIFQNLENEERYFERKKGKTKIMQLSSNVILYEDNRPRKFCYKDGFKVETMYSILSKKLFYGGLKDKKEIEFFLEHADETEKDSDA